MLRLCYVVMLLGCCLGTSVQKSVINYLGQNFLLLDGCPEPVCDRAMDTCQQSIATVRNLYSHCVQSEEGQHLGCVRDRLSAKEIITLPRC